jgi:hypothetical protein
MIPLEIFEYKLVWRQRSSFYVSLDTDLEYSAKRWCKNNLEKYQWDFSKYTDMYEDTFYFEKEEYQKRFEMEFLNGSTKTS